MIYHKGILAFTAHDGGGAVVGEVAVVPHCTGELVSDVLG